MSEMPRVLDDLVGGVVRVTSGPFADVTASVLAVDPARRRVQSTVDILGQTTRIDVPLSAVVPSCGAA
ncbi:transcription termination/antitermination protein NusG [Streptomyces sp. NPDC001205]